MSFAIELAVLLRVVVLEEKLKCVPGKYLEGLISPILGPRLMLIRYRCVLYLGNSRNSSHKNDILTFSSLNPTTISAYCCEASSRIMLPVLSENPPSYNSSSPPHYSPQPSSGEQSIQHSPRSNISPVPDGIFVQKDGRVTVLLTGQETGVSSPSYGRQSTINGTVLLDKHDNVSRVKVNVNRLHR